MKSIRITSKLVDSLIDGIINLRYLPDSYVKLTPCIHSRTPIPPETAGPNLQSEKLSIPYQHPHNLNFADWRFGPTVSGGMGILEWHKESVLRKNQGDI